MKSELFALCLQFIDARITTAQTAISDAASSADEETKSSAGDKYETGRAMLQLEMEKNAEHLAAAMNQKRALLGIPPDKSTSFVQPGSVVLTDNGNFYVAISAGKLTLNGTIYFAISPDTPIGIKMMKLKAGESFSVNGKAYKILGVE